MQVTYWYTSMATFQSTLPTRGSDGRGEGIYRAFGGFQSTLPTRGSDKSFFTEEKQMTHFNPRSPRGGATQVCKANGHGDTFQSTLPTRGSDDYGQYATAATQQISIHAPHEGERHSKIKDGKSSKLFQSTLPTRGSDLSAQRYLGHANAFQSTLPTRGSDGNHHGGFTAAAISIHAPHEGERLQRLWSGRLKINFNPRSPRGGATLNVIIIQLVT